MYSISYLWAKILLHLEEIFSDKVINEYLNNVEVVCLSDDTLIVHSPSKQVRQVIYEKFAPHILDILKDHLQCNAKLEVWGKTELNEYKKEQGNKPANINPQYLFSSYVVSTTNEMATVIAQAVAQNPGDEKYNPLYIYGPSGVGKTHLLHATANAILQNFPEKKVLYTLSDQFMGELIWSIQRGTLNEFEQKYLSADVLLIDDIQFVSRRQSTQEALYRILNCLYEHHKQIIISSNVSLNEIVGIEDYLKARLDQSLAVQIDRPNCIIRRTIIINFSKKNKLSLNEEVIDLLTNYYSNSEISEISAALKRLRTGYELNSLSLSKNNVEDFLGITSKQN